MDFTPYFVIAFLPSLGLECNQVQSAIAQEEYLASHDCVLKQPHTFDNKVLFEQRERERAGVCASAQTGPGCNNAECCNAVCAVDPFCCITTWDQSCVDRSNVICTACGRGQADCKTAHAGPGCSSISCCAKVCEADNFCCSTEWDASCAQKAAALCQ